MNWRSGILRSRGCGTRDDRWMLFALLHNRGKLTSNAGRCSARADAIRFFRSARETLAPPSYLFADHWCSVLLRCGFVCRNAVYRTANDGALFLAAVERAVEVAPKTKSGRAKLHAELVALAKIRGDKTGDKKVSKANHGGKCHAGATSSQGAR